MIPVRGFEGKRVAVFGLGRTMQVVLGPSYAGLRPVKVATPDADANPDAATPRARRVDVRSTPTPLIARSYRRPRQSIRYLAR